MFDFVNRVKNRNTISKTFEVEIGVRQRCILSPLLYNIYSEYIIRQVFDDWKGLSIGGRKVDSLRYANDTLIIASDEKELVKIITRLERSLAMARTAMVLDRDTLLRT